MPQGFEQLVEQIEHDVESNVLELPSLPEVVVQIQAAINDDKKGIPHIARLIQMDPTLSARILKIANSPLYRTNLELSDIKQAILKLGLGVTRNIITCLVVNNIFQVETARLHIQITELWQHSCKVAAISQVLASVTPGLQADRAMLAGLLHDIGVLPVLVYADRFPEVRSDPERLKQVIADLRADLGRRIIQQWNLGDDLINVPEAAEDWSRQHDGRVDYGDLVQIAQIHSYFGTAAMQGIPPLTEVPAFNKMSLSKMGPYAGIELLEQARADINATVRMLNGT